MRRYRHLSPLVKLGVDLLLLIASFFIAAFLSKNRISPGQSFLSLSPREGAILVVLLLTWYFSARLTNLYDEFRSQSLSFELVTILKVGLVQAGAAVLLLFINKDPRLNRYFVAVYFLTLLLLLVVSKSILRQHLLYLRRKGRNIRSVLILGATPIALTFAREVRDNPRLGYRVLGILDNRMRRVPGIDYLGRISRLEFLLRTHAVEEVVLALPTQVHRHIDHIIDICEKYTTRLRIISDYYLTLGHKSRVSLFGGLPVLSLNLNPLGDFANGLLKSAFDFIVSFVLFVTVFDWLFPLIALAIWLDSRGSVLFKQKRWGKDDVQFVCYKFRSMVPGCPQYDERGRFLQASRGDARVTRVGRFLRRTNLDELPQFWNVLKGDMSLVGPRPHPIPLGREAKDQVRYYLLRRRVRPGITGWAQVKGFRGETKNIILMKRRIEHDLWYIANWSFWLDLQIILLSVKTIFQPAPQAY